MMRTMAPLPAPEPYTTDDLTYLTELAAETEQIASRCARTPRLIESTYEFNAHLAEKNRHTPEAVRHAIARQRW